MFGRLADLVERFEGGRRWQILGLLAAGPLSEAGLGRHFRFAPTLRWHLRELHALGLVAYSRRGARYHLVRPAVEALADFCTQLDEAIVEVEPAGRPAGRYGPLARARRHVIRTHKRPAGGPPIGGPPAGLNLARSATARWKPR